ncbi:MAG: NAD(P)H-dependent oxidoreductase subunit E, partial [Oscillospiraceae bacterium]|nr:NAD(P)H-dependent oxidoreductase subunit E [Oscillospiraceae bacterium]
MGKLTRAQFISLRAEAKVLRERQGMQILVCAGTGCVASGSMKVYDYLKTAIEAKGLKVSVELKDEAGKKGLHLKKSGCHGFCEIGPLVAIEPAGILYTHVKVEDCDEIIEKSILSNEVIDRLLYEGKREYMHRDDIPFYKGQHRMVMKDSGRSDAEDIYEYLALGGYAAFEKALFEMEPAQICKEIVDSGLRGRGGGGFPAGRKWESVRRNVSDVKYVVCNGDEGDPGAFMDQGVMEGNPHSIIEGMLIAGIATGASEGYIYVRAEYPLAVKRLKIAMAKAEELGLLGDDIMGSGFSFHLHINRGAGAFVCGEGSALTASIEGKRGMPRVKPPRTVDQGLWAKPTVLNNVETFANVPNIIMNGAAWYRSVGTENS